MVHAASSPSTWSNSSASTSPISQNITTPHNGNTIESSPGEVAGIAVGAAFAGALLAVVVFWIFMRRTTRSGGRRGDAARRSREIDVEPSIVATNKITLDDNLIERADDSQIRKSMQDLNELIDQHVENHYHLRAFEGSQGNLEQYLIECGYSTDPSVQDMVFILQNPKSRFAGIRQLIAAIILRNIDCKTTAEMCLLPPQIAEFCQVIPPVEKQPGCEEVFDKAFTKWRHLTAFLLEPVRTNREAPKANERDLQGPIRQNVALINGVLKPFMMPGLENQRYQEDNLSAIIFQGAQLGILLFSQPSVWIFGWKAPVKEQFNRKEKNDTRVSTSEIQTRREETARILVVFPALDERTERHRRQRMREVVPPVVINL